MDFRKIKAIEQKNKERILKVCPEVTERSGIYIIAREENGFKYAYIGQAKNILSRLAQHLSGYQHIDLSLKKHGFYSESNPTGYRIEWHYCPIESLDELEQQYILKYANAGYQLRNKTAGGQCEGKHGIAENKPSKGYRDGLRQGYENARRDAAKWCEKLIIAPNGGAKINARYHEEFIKFLKNEEVK